MNVSSQDNFEIPAKNDPLEKKFEVNQAIIMFISMYGYPLVTKDELDNLPTILAQRNSEFAVTDSFDPYIIALGAHKGIFTMATDFREPVPLLKLHKKRCIIQNLSEFHVPKKLKPKAKKFEFSMNQSFDQVADLIYQQHGSNWMYPQLLAAYRKIFDSPKGHYGKMRVISIEVWEKSNPCKLAAGELGFVIGSCYTSLTGGYCVDSAGSVQLYCLGKMLARQGFKTWDLGMSLPYKLSLGAKAVPRNEWLQIIASDRKDDIELEFPRVSADLVLRDTLPSSESQS